MWEHISNGTQGIVEDVSKSAIERDQLFFYSIHLYDSHRICKHEDLTDELESPSSARHGSHVHDPANALRRRPEAAEEEPWEFYPGASCFYCCRPHAWFRQSQQPV